MRSIIDKLLDTSIPSHGFLSNFHIVIIAIGLVLGTLVFIINPVLGLLILLTCLFAPFFIK